MINFIISRTYQLAMTSIKTIVNHLTRVIHAIRRAIVHGVGVQVAAMAERKKVVLRLKNHVLFLLFLRNFNSFKQKFTSQDKLVSQYQG